MHLRFLPTCLNVDRFPIEHRLSPSLALMRVIAPSLDEVVTVAEAFGLQRPLANPRRIAAVKIVSALRRSGLLADEEGRHEFLERRRAESIAAAVEGCAASDRLLAEALVAQRWLSAAEAAGEPAHVRLPLQREADRTAVLAAQAFVRASRLCEEVEGFVLVMEHLGGGMPEGEVARQRQALGRSSPAHGTGLQTIEPPRPVGGGNQQQRHDKTKGVRAKEPPFG
jgi:hypothetical protein